MQLLVVIIVCMATLDFCISYLNYSYRERELPETVKDIYTAEDYFKWLAYSMAQFKLGMLEKFLSVLVIAFMLLSGLLLHFDAYIADQIAYAPFRSVIFLVTLMLASGVMGLPFNYYHAFVIEEKFGFNKMTHGTFILDFIKKTLLTVVISSGIILGMHALLLQFETALLTFVVFAWLASTAFMLVFSLLNTTVFVRLFNTLSPLEEGSLKERIELLALQVGFSMKRISVMDASKRSTKLNAFFSGFGKVKDVVLFDTLIEKLSEEEIVSVLAHELGHAKHRDVIKMMLRGILVLGWYLSVLTFLLSSTTLSFGLALIVLVLVMQPIDFLIGIGFNYLSRKAEYAADAYSATYVHKDHMISALKKLVKENFSNLSPHPAYVIVHYTHPPVSERIKALEGL